MRRGRTTSARLAVCPCGLLLAAMFVVCAALPLLSAGEDASGTLFVVVRDAGSRPVPDAKISVESTVGLKLVATTGTNGTWRFTLPEGNYNISVSKTGFRTQTIFKPVPDLENVTAEFLLAADPEGPTGTLFVEVFDSGSRPVPEASIAVDSTPAGVRFGATTGANGTWEFAVPEGNYNIVVSKQGYRTQTVFKHVPDAVNVTAKFLLAADPEGPVGGGFYAWIGVLAAVVVLGVVGLLLKGRRVKRLEEEAKRSETDSSAKEEPGVTPVQAEAKRRTSAEDGGDDPGKKQIDIVDGK